MINMSKLLEDINYPRDVKTLTNKELYKLSDEIREFLIEQVSKTGGHQFRLVLRPRRGHDERNRAGLPGDEHPHPAL